MAVMATARAEDHLKKVAQVARPSRSAASARRRTPKSLLAASILLGIGGGLIACGADPEPPPEPVRPVKILTLGAGAGSIQLEFPGTLEAAQSARMAFEVPGRIIDFPVVEGDRLTKGDLIARLDPRDFEEALSKEQASADFLKVELERRQSLFDQGVDSKQILDRAQKNYDVALSSLAQARKALSDSQLRAPFDGVVAVTLVNDFRNVQAREAIAVFEDNSYLKIVVWLPEADYARLVPGLSLEERNANLDLRVVVTPLPNREFPARITEAASTADPVTRTFRITLAFETPRDVLVSSGMTAKVIVGRTAGSPSTSSSFTIPVQAAVGDEAGNAFVWILDPDSMKVSRSPVELGQVSGSMVQVIGGLKDGDQIVTSGVGQLRDGLQVRRMGS